jgi:hypothetical protein
VSRVAAVAQIDETFSSGSWSDTKLLDNAPDVDLEIPLITREDGKEFKIGDVSNDWNQIIKKRAK